MTAVLPDLTIPTPVQSDPGAPAPPCPTWCTSHDAYLDSDGSTLHLHSTAATEAGCYHIRVRQGVHVEADGRVEPDPDPAEVVVDGEALSVAEVHQLIGGLTRAAEQITAPAVPDTPVPADVPHPAWCDARRCHVNTARCADGLEPLLVHEGELYRDTRRAVVVHQCEVLAEDLTTVLTTCPPMVRIEGEFAGDPMYLDRAGDVGYVLWTAQHARGALPVTDAAAS